MNTLTEEVVPETAVLAEEDVGTDAVVEPTLDEEPAPVAQPVADPLADLFAQEQAFVSILRAGQSRRRQHRHWQRPGLWLLILTPTVISSQ